MSASEHPTSSASESVSFLHTFLREDNAVTLSSTLLTGNSAPDTSSELGGFSNTTEPAKRMQNDNYFFLGGPKESLRLKESANLPLMLVAPPLAAARDATQDLPACTSWGESDGTHGFVHCRSWGVVLAIKSALAPSGAVTNRLNVTLPAALADKIGALLSADELAPRRTKFEANGGLSGQVHWGAGFATLVFSVDYPAGHAIVEASFTSSQAAALGRLLQAQAFAWRAQHTDGEQAA